MTSAGRSLLTAISSNNSVQLNGMLYWLTGLIFSSFASTIACKLQRASVTIYSIRMPFMLIDMETGSIGCISYLFTKFLDGCAPFSVRI